MIISTITQRGQTTLPKQIRERFGLDAGNKLVYEITDNGFIVRPHPGVMASFGALKGEGDKINVLPEEARKQARQEWVDHASSEG